MPSSTASCTQRTASPSTARPCANHQKNPPSVASLTPTTPSEPLKPSMGAAVRDHRNAVRDRSESCPQSIGTPVRNRRNPQYVFVGHASHRPHKAAFRFGSGARHEPNRSEEHTSELQSPDHLVCRLLLEKKKKNTREADDIADTGQDSEVRRALMIVGKLQAKQQHRDVCSTEDGQSCSKEALSENQHKQ